MEFLVSLRSVGLLVALIIPGYILRKRKMLGDGVAGGLTVILLYVSLPFLTFSSFMKKPFELDLVVNMGIVFVLGFVLLIGGFSLARLCFALSPDDPAKKVCVTAGFLSNCAFMGIPVLQAFFPGDSEPIMYCAVFSVVFNLLAWTLLVYSLTGEKRHIRIRRAIGNPPTIAVILALPLFFLGIPVPAPVMTMVDFLGNMTTPLSMCVIGIRLADIAIRSLFQSRKVYMASLVKLILMPLAALGFLLLLRLILPLEGKLVITLYILMAMPTASSVSLFAELFGGDTGTAVTCILLSSLLGILTIPLLMLLPPLV